MVIAEENQSESVEIDLKCPEKVTDSDVEDTVFESEKHSEINKKFLKTIIYYIRIQIMCISKNNSNNKMMAVVVIMKQTPQKQQMIAKMKSRINRNQ